MSEKRKREKGGERVTVEVKRRSYRHTVDQLGSNSRPTYPGSRSPVSLSFGTADRKARG